MRTTVRPAVGSMVRSMMGPMVRFMVRPSVSLWPMVSKVTMVPEMMARLSHAITVKCFVVHFWNKKKKNSLVLWHSTMSNKLM